MRKLKFKNLMIFRLKNAQVWEAHLKKSSANFGSFLNFGNFFSISIAKFRNFSLFLNSNVSFLSTGSENSWTSGFWIVVYDLRLKDSNRTEGEECFWMIDINVIQATSSCIPWNRPDVRIHITQLSINYGWIWSWDDRSTIKWKQFYGTNVTDDLVLSDLNMHLVDMIFTCFHLIQICCICYQFFQNHWGFLLIEVFGKVFGWNYWKNRAQISLLDAELHSHFQVLHADLGKRINFEKIHVTLQNKVPKMSIHDYFLF